MNFSTYLDVDILLLVCLNDGTSESILLSRVDSLVYKLERWLDEWDVDSYESLLSFK